MGNLNCKSRSAVIKTGDSNNNTSNIINIKETTVPSSIKDDEFAIPIKIYTPNNNKSIRAAVFFIHGGIFSSGDCHSHPTIAEGLANLGLVVVTASFRNGKEAPHATNITNKDLNDVIDYIRSRWKNIPFGLVGSSSGGFFALNLSQTLGPSVISFCIPICPVADPFKRASYLRSSISGSAISDGYKTSHTTTDSKRILEKQLSFWKDDDSMLQAGGSLTSPKHEDIPTLMIIGSQDKNVPFKVTADVQSWATRTIVIGKRGHELCDEVVNGGGYHCYLGDIDRFIDYSLSLKK